MTREEMWKEFENQLIRETRTHVTMSFDDAETMTKLGIKETVAKWKRRLEQTRWIPVSERLPKEDETVIVSITDDSGDSEYRYTSCAWYYDGIWVMNNERISSSFVKAWMPLPQSYRGEVGESE